MRSGGTIQAMTTERSPADDQTRQAVVEWGAGGDNLTITVSWEQVVRILAAPLAVLASLTVLVATLLPWQTLSVLTDEDAFPEVRYTLGLGGVPVWGTCWLLGIIALATVTWYALFSVEPLRRRVRTAGLCLTGVLVALLVSAGVELSRFNAGVPRLSGVDSVIHRPSVGYVLAVIGTLLFGAALWFSSHVRPGMYPWLRRDDTLGSTGSSVGPRGGPADRSGDGPDDSPDDSPDEAPGGPSDGSGGSSGGGPSAGGTGGGRGKRIHGGVRDLTVQRG